MINAQPSKASKRDIFLESKPRKNLSNKNKKKSPRKKPAKKAREKTTKMPAKRPLN